LLVIRRHYNDREVALASWAISLRVDIIGYNRSN
jgi:hypothetical protein